MVCRSKVLHRAIVPHYTHGGGTSGVPYRVLGTLAFLTQHLAGYPVHDAVNYPAVIMSGAGVI